MRVVPASIGAKINNRIQTINNDANPALDARITRPTIPLTDEKFLERQTITEDNGLEDCSIAVQHSQFGSHNNSVFVAYIEDGELSVVRAVTKARMSDHVWVDTQTHASGVKACAIAFDGKYEQAYGGNVEFITDNQPWVFYIDDDGALWGRIVGMLGWTMLTNANATDVTAIRASNDLSQDFGLCLFFIIEGQIYVRQLINGEWTDASVVTFGPNKTWVEIAATRTWDYRICLQAKASDGTIYEMFSNYQGIGRHLTENIVISDVDAHAELTAIRYWDLKNRDEHIDISEVAGSARRYYAYSITPTTAANIDDGEDNWGLYVEIPMGQERFLTVGSASASGFVMTDTNGRTYQGNLVTVDNDECVLTVRFADFNRAARADSVTITYTPVENGLSAIAEEQQEFSITFVPTNLVAPDVPIPVVDYIENV